MIKNPQGKTRAFAKLVVDDVMEINGFKIIEGIKGLFVGKPQTKGKNKDGEVTWYDDVRFLDAKEEDAYRTPVEEEICKAILDKYLSLTSSSEQSTRGSAANAQASVANGNPLWD